MLGPRPAQAPCGPAQGFVTLVVDPVPCRSSAFVNHLGVGMAGSAMGSRCGMNGTAAGVGLNDRLVRIFGSSASLRDALVLLAAAVLAIVLEMFVDLLPTLAGLVAPAPGLADRHAVHPGASSWRSASSPSRFRRMREIGAVARRRSEAEARFRDFAAMADEWFWEMDDQLRLSVVDDQAPAPLVALAKQHAPWQPRVGRRRCLGAAPGRARRQEAVSRLSLPYHRRCRHRPPHPDQRQAVLRSRRQLSRLSRHRHGRHRGRHRRSRERAPRPFRPADRPAQPHAALRRGRSCRCAGPRPRPAGGAAAHRSRPLSRDQRHARALDRRSAAQGLRAAPGGVHRCWRPPGAHQRRRVRDRAARPGSAGRRDAAVLAVCWRASPSRSISTARR